MFLDVSTPPFAPRRVLAAVIARDDRWLIALRPTHKQHGGLWEFPGGKCEPGESDEDTIRRELDEELAVATAHVGPIRFMRHDHGSPFEIVFRDVAIVGEPVAREHDAIRWATLAELRTLSLAPTDAAFVATFVATMT
jgi:mutator protein MutT